MYPVGHGDQPQVLLADLLAGGGKLGDRPDRGGLGGLSAGVGVDLGVQNQDIDVAAAGQNMVQPAVADVIGPTVSTEDPDALVEDEVGQSLDPLQQRLDLAGRALDGCGQGGLDRVGSRLGLGIGAVPELQALFEGAAQVRPFGDQCFDQLLELAAVGINRQPHPEAVLGVVLEEGVTPGRTLTAAVDAVGHGREGPAVDGGAAGRVGDNHPVPEELGNEPHVGGLAAAGAGAGKLEERLQELAALECLGIDTLGVDRQGVKEGDILHLAGLAFLDQRPHLERLGLGGAGLHAAAATDTVLDIDLDLVLQLLVVLGGGLDRLEGGRGVLHVGRIDLLGPIVACGQTKEHWLHWMQFSAIQCGT